MCHNKGLLGDSGEEIMDPLIYPSQYIDIHIDSHERSIDILTFVCVFSGFEAKHVDQNDSQ